MPDAIMEPDVLKTVNEFNQAGGNITEVIESLTSSYVGMRGTIEVHAAGNVMHAAAPT